jgi:hypothetical protein
MVLPPAKKRPPVRDERSRTGAPWDRDGPPVARIADLQARFLKRSLLRELQAVRVPPGDGTRVLGECFRAPYTDKGE